jgi:hypothetical protein
MIIPVSFAMMSRIGLEHIFNIQMVLARNIYPLCRHHPRVTPRVNTSKRDLLVLQKMMKPLSTLQSPSIVVHKDTLTHCELHDNDVLIWAVKGVFARSRPANLHSSSCQKLMAHACISYKNV